jgi:hypothetical protein
LDVWLGCNEDAIPVEGLVFIAIIQFKGLLSSMLLTKILGWGARCTCTSCRRGTSLACGKVVLGYEKIVEKHAEKRKKRL